MSSLRRLLRKAASTGYNSRLVVMPQVCHLHRCVVRFEAESSILRVKSNLAEKLNLSESDYNVILVRLKNVPNSRLVELDQSIDLLRANFGLEDIRHNVSLLCTHYDDLQNRIDILRELGFENLEIKVMNSVPSLMRRTLGELKANGLYPSDSNPHLALLDYMKRRNLLAEDYQCTDPQLNTGAVHSLTIKEIRLRSFYHLTKQILDCSEQVATHVVDSLDTQKAFTEISLVKMVENLKYFIDVIQLPINLLMKNCKYLTVAKIDNLRKLSKIRLFEEDASIGLAFFSRITLIQIDAEEIERRINLLIDRFNCTHEQFADHIFVLELSCKQIEANFQKFHSQDALAVYGGSRELLRIISNIDQVLANIRTLAEHDISAKYITLANLLKSGANFDRMVSNQNFKLTLNLFTQLHFGRSLKEIRARIGSPKAPSRTLHSRNAESVVNFFRDKGLSDEQIVNAIYLVYLDFELIESLWDRMLEFKLVKQSNFDWNKHPYFLQLLYYFLDRGEKNCL